MAIGKTISQTQGTTATRRISPLTIEEIKPSHKCITSESSDHNQIWLTHEHIIIGVSACEKGVSGLAEHHLKLLVLLKKCFRDEPGVLFHHLSDKSGALSRGAPELSPWRQAMLLLCYSLCILWHQISSVLPRVEHRRIGGLRVHCSPSDSSRCVDQKGSVVRIGVSR